jgi:uncharacterized membrane protein
MTHYHFLGAAAGSAALIAFLNSPPAQRDMMHYLSFMEHGIYTLAANLRNNVKTMTKGGEPQIVYPKNAPMPNHNATDENQTNQTNKLKQTIETNNIQTQTNEEK